MTRPLSALLALAAFVVAPSQGQEPPSGTIIVANRGGDSVWLVDAATGDLRASIDTHIAPHEVAVSSDGRLAAITNYGDQRGPGNVVQLVDVATGALTHEITVEGFERLHGAAFLAGDSELALTSERTGEVVVVSVTDGSLIRRIAAGARNTHMLAPGGRWLYVASTSDGAVSRVDPEGRAPTRVWPVGATRTEGVAATPDGTQGWTASMDSGEVFGVDGASGEIVASVGGLDVPYQLAVTPDGTTVVVSDPDAGRLVLIDRARGAVVGSVDIDAAARAAGLGDASSPQGFTLSPDGAWAFVSANAIGHVALVHLASRRVVRFVQAGTEPDGIAFSPVGG
jgi:DNA-binding beta-propeller fold protein YncE